MLILFKLSEQEMLKRQKKNILFIVFYLYLFICSWAIMVLCINKVSSILAFLYQRLASRGLPSYDKR